MTGPRVAQRKEPTTRFTRKGQATKERIVATAAHLMFLGGVAGTSIEDVQKAASVSTSQLYHYFGDKQGLIRAVIAHQAETSLAGQRPIIDQLDSLDAFQAWRDLLVGIQKQRHSRGGCTLGSLASQLVEIQPDARDDLVAAFAEWEMPIHRGLQAMRERGELRADADPDHLALATLAALQGGLLLTQTRRETTPLEVALDTMIEHIRTFAVPPISS
jgi:AcrR family transcriptional regulator